MDGLQTWPAKYLRCFENAAQEVLIQLIGDGANSRPTEMQVYLLGLLNLFTTHQVLLLSVITFASVCVVQVILHSDQSPTDLRSITADHMNRLTKIPGIIIGCHSVQSKAHAVSAQCRSFHECHVIHIFTIHCAAVGYLLAAVLNY